MIAAQNQAVAETARQVMESPRFLLSTGSDVVGVELGGSLKNIIALGAGMIDGLGLGDNAKGAFMAWGWTEAVSLGVALGASADTFCGLAGTGRPDSYLCGQPEPEPLRRVRTGQGPPVRRDILIYVERGGGSGHHKGGASSGRKARAGPADSATDPRNSIRRAVPQPGTG